MNIFKKLFGRKKDGPTITSREYNPDPRPEELKRPTQGRGVQLSVELATSVEPPC